MVRSFWAGALAGVFACAAPSWGQSTPVKADTKAPAERVITVKEAGKPEQKCRVLRCWEQKDGSRVCEVQDIATGEKMTIQEEVAGTNKKSLAQIFRWGKSEAAPAGVPAAPAGATVVGKPTSDRPSLFGRAFASKKPTPAKTITRQADPRESWGKVERWTAADSDKAVATASARAESADPKRPLAAKTAHDPLMHPDTYAPVPVGKTEVIEKMGSMPAPVVMHEGKPVAAPRPNLMSRLRASKGPAVSAAATPASTAPGMGSVMAASSPRMARELDTVMTVDKDGQPVVVPRSEVSPKMVAVEVSAPNAFSAPMPVRMPTAAPTHMPMPPMMMPGGGGMMMAGMSMAPAYPPTMQGAPMMHPAMMTMAPVPQAAMPDQAAYTAGLLHELRDGQLPSQREMAADQLSRANWRMEPAVVQGLMHSAKADPAPMVRACCVQGLAKMKANTVPVVQAVNACKQDSDSRVRQAAEQALAVLLSEK